MSDDLLARATRALRETTDEPEPRSGLTRARVLDGAERRYAPRRTRALRWAIILAGGLFASSALARVAHYWPEIKRALSLESAVAVPDAGAKPRRPGAPSKPKPRAEPQPNVLAREEGVHPATAGEPAPSPIQNDDAVAPPNAAPVQPLAPSAGAASAAPRARDKRGLKREPASPSESSAPAAQLEDKSALEPAGTKGSGEAAPNQAKSPAPAVESAELALFRRAQRLHVARDPAALGAWDDYLRVAPRGPLAPEARYNRALSLVWLGRTAAARAALEPFARGAFGDYRRRDAQRLLEALSAQGHAGASARER